MLRASIWFFVRLSVMLSYFLFIFLFLEILFLLLYLAIFTIIGLTLPSLRITNLWTWSWFSPTISSLIFSFKASTTLWFVFSFLLSWSQWIVKLFLMVYWSCQSNLTLSNCMLADISFVSRHINFFLHIFYFLFHTLFIQLIRMTTQSGEDNPSAKISSSLCTPFKFVLNNHHLLSYC